MLSRKVLPLLRLTMAMMAFLLVTGPGRRVHAQFYNGSQMTFGKNRVQWGNFQWTYYQFDRFDTYFYLNGKELALFTAQYAQEQIKDIEKKLETNLDDKIEFILFNSLSDMKQSNLGILNQEESYNTGGITNILDQKVILYQNGDHEFLKKQIRQGITTVILNKMLYGSSLTSQVKNSTLLFLPDWYLQGLISYLTEDWNTDLDNRVRDGIQSGRYQKFSHLTGEDAAYAGHSIWKFVADRYGSTVISNIVYMAKISKNVESGFMFVLGTSFRTISKEWINYYLEQYHQEAVADTLPENAGRLVRSNTRTVIQQVKVNPEGNHVAYVTNESGKYKVFIRDLNRKKTDRIIKRGYCSDNITDYSYPLLAWHPTGKLLAIMTEEKGKINLYFYTLSSGKMDRRFLFTFDKIVDFSYSPDGKNLALSAVIKGQTDLFVLNLSSNSFEQLTKDLYDDLNPRFIDKGKKIIFTSNRLDDTLRFGGDPEFYAEMPDKHDVFVYDYAGKKKLLRRVTQTALADERYPVEYSDGYMSYLSDENGVYNRYIARFDSTISFVDTTTHYRYTTVTYPVTNYVRNIVDQDIQPKAGKYGEILFFGNRYHLYSGELSPAKKLSSSTLNKTPFMVQLHKEKHEQQTDSLLQIKKQYQSRKKKFVNVGADEVSYPVDTVAASTGSKIDINNYVFEKQAFKKLASRDSLQNRPPIAVPTGSKGKSGLSIPIQQNYVTEYSINQLVSQADFTYLNYTYQPFTGGNQPIFLNPGFNVLLKVGVSDLMENFRITGGVRLSLSLTNNEYLLSFTNLKNRLDREITFHRQVVENSMTEPTYSVVRHTSHEAMYLFSWPFNEILSLRGTATFRNDRAVYLSTDEQNLRTPDVIQNWGGIKGELVYDATRNLGLNLYYGTRYKVFGEYYQKMGVSEKGLCVLGFDLRNYQRIHRTFIWANRVAGSTSFGGNKLVYFMGGVDNWLNPKFNQDVPVSTTQPYAYQTLATNMRGFTQNIRNGNSFAVLNTELRMPVFRYFANRPIKSDFINNFQVVAFGDLGTAWNGPGPYSKQNSLYQRVVKQGPIKVTIDNQVEPVVGGYGLGLRTRFLGYFLRADWAWGVEDLKVGKPLFYLSLSLDF